ncbi:MAG: histidine kinase [Bacteroidetes bacterium]|nr:histidine kinase [Bacteroidota bacterium]
MAVILFSANLTLPAQNPYIQHYTTQDGLPSNTVYYVFQDSRKFLWFATDAGVSRYDGTSFTNYRKKDGLASNDVIRIKEDSYGRIWFFHYSGLLSFIVRNKIYSETNTPYLKSLEGKEFYFDFIQDEDSTIYFYNRYSEIIALDRHNNVTRYNIRDKLMHTHAVLRERHPLFYLRRITKSLSGDFLFWTGNALFKQKTFTGITRFVSAIAATYTVFPVGKNTYLVDSYTSKLYKYRDECLVDSLIIPFYTENFLKSVLKDDGERIWVADYFQGVYCMDHDTVIHRFDIQKPQSMLRDHESNIWIGSVNDGVYKISPYLLSHRHYSSRFFGEKGIVGMCREGSGGVWLSNGNKVSLLKNNEFYALNFGNRVDYINFLFQVKTGSLIIGEKGVAMYNIEGAKADNITKTVNYRLSEKMSLVLKAMAMQKKGKEISAFVGSSLQYSDQDHLFREKKEINLGMRIYSIFYDVNDDLIVNSLKMLVFGENKLVPCRALARFDNKIITNHLNIGDKAEIYNIEGDTLYVNIRKVFYNLSEAFGAPVDLQVRNITYDEPTLYLSTSRNVYRCDNPLEVISGRKIRFKLLDINFRNIHEILVNHDSLYIASDDGLTIIPETLIGRMVTQVPNPYIRSVLVNDAEEDPGDQGVTIRGSTKIAFSCGCINYSSAPVVFAYKLEGLDTAWTTGTSGNVIYQRLLSGNYTFKLKVRKSTSEWSGVIEYPFQIKASFWRHPMFFASLVIVVLLGITLLIIRRKNIQMRHRELDHHLVTLELKSLQSMMNPHFIFNTLGSIQNFLLKNKTGEAGLYLSQFARLIRQNMNALNESMINLDEEFDRLSNYLDLERLRMENKFTYKIDIDNSFDPEEIMIPAMIIQPFVENSIWHGISALDDKGFISILFSLLDEHSLKVVITDNGIGIKKAQALQTKSEKHLKLGMEMTLKRLELLGRKYAVKTRVDLSEAFPGEPNPGTRVVVVIPFSYVDNI